MPRPARHLVGLRPVQGAHNLWIGTLDNGAEVEVSDRLLKLAAEDRRPVAVAPLTVRSEVAPAVGRAPGDQPPRPPVVRVRPARVLAPGQKPKPQKCSFCEGDGHNLRTCEKMKQASQEDQDIARTEARAQGRQGHNAARERRQRANALAAARGASNAGGGA